MDPIERPEPESMTVSQIMQAYDIQGSYNDGDLLVAIMRKLLVLERDISELSGLL
jgi:hypothetical protein